MPRLFCETIAGGKARLTGEDAALWHALREEDPGRCTAQLLRWCGGVIRAFG